MQDMEESKGRRKTPNTPRPNEFLVKLRGLPFSIAERDIVQFFQGIKFPKEWVNIVTGPGGRTTGEAFVEFHTDADMKKALQRDREKIGSRYVELFASSAAEMNAVLRKAESESAWICICPRFPFVLCADHVFFSKISQRLEGAKTDLGVVVAVAGMGMVEEGMAAVAAAEVVVVATGPKTIRLLGMVLVLHEVAGAVMVVLQTIFCV